MEEGSAVIVIQTIHDATQFPAPGTVADAPFPFSSRETAVTAQK